MKRSKYQKALEGKTLKKIKHVNGNLVLYFEEGLTWNINAESTTDGGWKISGATLRLELKE